MIPIASLLPRASELYPDRCAIRDSDKSQTYAELFERVRTLAGVLLQRGLKKGDRVAVLDHNSHQYAETYYACAHAGLILVPLNSRLAAPELIYQLNDAGAKGLFVGKAHLEIAAAIKPSLSTVEWFISNSAEGPAEFLAYDDLLAIASPTATTPHPSQPDDVAQIYYTSGTTGEPKGVCLTHGNMITSAIDSVIGLELNERDRWLHAAPMFHLVDAWAIWAMPLLGASQVMLQFTPEKALQVIEATRATAAGLPPALIDGMTSHPNIGRYDLSSMRVICYGGAPTRLGTLQRASKVIPARFAHGYGITETSGIASLASANDFYLSGTDEQLGLTASAGRPLPNVDIAVVDPNGESLPAGQIGEIVVSGSRVMREYWNKPTQTSSALRNGRYHTGDVGYLDPQHRLYIVDRLKDMIITGGENVYSVEVERIVGEHPAVREVAVIGIPSDRWGEEVAAIVVLKDGSFASESDLITFCDGRVANYKKPKRVIFRQGELPKTGPGKIAKAKLRSSYWVGRGSNI